MKEEFCIAVDFDGTVVTNNYPKVGKDIGAGPVLMEMVAQGYKIILNTMRSGRELADAVAWFKERQIPLYGVNKHPTQDTWTTSGKVYAQLYIDDHNFGTPLCRFKENGRVRAFVNWYEIYANLVGQGVLVGNNNVFEKITDEVVGSDVLLG